jgi:hypothetical protein
VNLPPNSASSAHPTAPARAFPGIPIYFPEQINQAFQDTHHASPSEKCSSKLPLLIEFSPSSDLERNECESESIENAGVCEESRRLRRVKQGGFTINAHSIFVVDQMNKVVRELTRAALDRFE